MVQFWFHFCKKEVINRIISVILDLVGLLCQTTMGRRSILTGVKLLAAHRLVFLMHIYIYIYIYIHIYIYIATVFKNKAR